MTMKLAQTKWRGWVLLGPSLDDVEAARQRLESGRPGPLAELAVVSALKMESPVPMGGAADLFLRLNLEGLAPGQQETLRRHFAAEAVRQGITARAGWVATTLRGGMDLQLGIALEEAQPLESVLRLAAFMREVVGAQMVVKVSAALMA